MTFTFSNKQKIMRAARQGNIDAIESVYRFDIPKKHHIPILFIASERNHSKLIQHMITKYNVSVDSMHGGSPALNIASENNSLEAVKLLLANGANVNIQDCVGDNAAMSAKLYGSSDVYDLLYDRSELDHNTRNDEGVNLDGLAFGALASDALLSLGEMLTLTE